MAANNLPVGYKFEPTKEILIEYFLKNRLSNEPLDPCYNDVIMDFDVYSDHPSNIMAKTNRKVEGNGFRQGYFFSSLKKTSKKGKTGKNINRFIPTHGTWSEKAATTMVRNEDDEVIGIHKYYRFTPKSKSKDSVLNEDGWMMHEYSISDRQDLVLCHISNKKKSNSKSTKAARKIIMVVDQSLDHEAGPSKRCRVDPPYIECIDDLLSVISHNSAGNKRAADGGVKDESSTLFENGFKHAMEQIVAQEDDDGNGIGIPAEEMALIQAVASKVDPPTTEEELDNLLPFLMA